jgi:hypothetical protein
MSPPKRIQLHFDVATDDQAAELSAAWEEIVSGKRTRMITTAEQIEDRLSHYEAKVFGGLLATQRSPDEERPLGHARLLSEAATKPLCGATDGPWSTRTFDIQRTTCHECQGLVLDPENSPA